MDKQSEEDSKGSELHQRVPEELQKELSEKEGANSSVTSVNSRTWNLNLPTMLLENVTLGRLFQAYTDFKSANKTGHWTQLDKTPIHLLTQWMERMSTQLKPTRTIPISYLQRNQQQSVQNETEANITSHDTSSRHNHSLIPTPNSPSLNTRHPSQLKSKSPPQLHSSYLARKDMLPPTEHYAPQQLNQYIHSPIHNKWRRQDYIPTNNWRREDYIPNNNWRQDNIPNNNWRREDYVPNNNWRQDNIPNNNWRRPDYIPSNNWRRQDFIINSNWNRHDYIPHLGHENTQAGGSMPDAVRNSLLLLSVIGGLLFLGGKATGFVRKRSNELDRERQLTILERRVRDAIHKWDNI